MSRLLLRLGLFAPLAAFSNTIASADDRPNLLVIVSDDQGYRDLGCFGNPRIQTPHLDRLAAHGAKLTRFYVTWPACTPSRASLLTGRYPQRNGLYDMIRNDVVDYGRRMDPYEYAISPEMTLGLDSREITLAQMLKSSGYATGAIGKWDSGRAKRFLPTRRGFDSFLGFANTGIDYWTHERYGVPSMFRDLEPIRLEGYATDLFGDEAVRFIDAHHDQPFFLYLAFNAPHAPSNLEKTGPQAPREAIARYPDLDPKAAKTRYLACVSRMDDAIGAVLDAIEKHYLQNRTLILFCSDNGGSGPSDNGPLRGGKSQMFEGGLRVPAIARWPGVIPAGSTRDDFLTTLEIVPTVLAATGTPPPEGVVLDGFDILPCLRGDAPSPRQSMFWERRGDRAAMIGTFKWVDSARGKGLFDLSSDLGEQNDLSATRPAMLADLRARFDAWKAEMDRAAPRGPFRDD